MKEIITAIEKHSWEVDCSQYSCLEDQMVPMEGYRVVTNKREILFGIESEQLCCEQWGYLVSEDDINSFIGTELLDVTVTEDSKDRITIGLKELVVDAYADVNTMFVNFETSEGTLQFAVYNAHNGYYGHYVSFLVGDKDEAGGVTLL
jgi:hypothetical protein